ncbi:hypothetical protein BCR44DRAFT_1426222 [Catenaria anguillulae PL171]|uniref:Uncharacterized protein n=1 Tax=Catenaria anguillulae PL171 TaxID=765915 RepID=A0A1Y2I1K6_9FUNG|nr:hypothetical protein BCR44DRAFT_1426222 [Catenaria anguillulae PL171]
MSPDMLPRPLRSNVERCGRRCRSRLSQSWSVAHCCRPCRAWSRGPRLRRAFDGGIDSCKTASCVVQVALGLVLQFQYRRVNAIQ